jgi:hypothetical protein
MGADSVIFQSFKNCPVLVFINLDLNRYGLEVGVSNYYIQIYVLVIYQKPKWL